MVKEPAGTKFDIDIRKKLFASVELYRYFCAYVVLAGDTAGPDALSEHFAD